MTCFRKLPGIPDPNSLATLTGLCNIDPAARFGATQPGLGILRPMVVHPKAFTFKPPDNASFAQATMVEPLSVGVHAATSTRIKPGEVALVSGVGPIGLVTAQAALSAGCARVYVTDIDETTRAIASSLSTAITALNVKSGPLSQIVHQMDGWGVEVVLECSGLAA